MTLTEREIGQLKMGVSLLKDTMFAFPWKVPEKIVGWEPTRAFLTGQEPIMAPKQKRWSASSVNKWLEVERKRCNDILHAMSYILADNYLPDDIIRETKNES